MTSTRHFHLRGVVALGLVFAALFLSGADTRAASTGLVAAYSFNEGMGTTIGDLSGNTNNGTIAAATWTAAGKAGGALSFNGASSYASVPDSPSLRLSGAMTLEAWVRPATLGTSYRTVLLKQQTSQLAFGLYANNHATRPTANAYVAGDNEQQGTAALPLNAWSFLAGTYDGATLRLYVNGALVGSKALTGALVAGTGPLRIGGNSLWSEWFSGAIDEVRIYSRALSSAELSSDMTTPVAPGATDTTPPSPPGGLAQTASTQASASVSWRASTDDAGVTGYDVYLDGAKTSTITSTSATFTGLLCGSSHTVGVDAYDSAGNISTRATAPATTQACSDTTPPQTPGTLTQTGATISSVSVAWSASLDDTGVTGYEVFRNGTRVASTTATTATVSGLACNARPTIEVDAFDAAGNISPRAGIVATAAACDTTPPQVRLTSPAPGAVVNGTVSLAASATDDIGLASVRFTVDGNAVGAPITSGPYTLGWASGSVATGSHVIAATAVDTSGNAATTPGVTITVSNTLDTANAMKRVAVGPGYVDASVRGVIRTAADRVYVFVADDTPQRRGTGPGVIHAYRADQTGVPLSFTEADAAHRPSATGSTHVLGAPDVRLDRSGIARLAYIDESTHTVIYRTFSPATDTWGPATTLGTGAAFTASAIKREGNVALVLDNGDAPNVVYATSSGIMFTSLSGGAWSAPVQVASGTGAAHPQLAADAGGVLHLAWLNASAGPSPSIRYATRRTDGTWSAFETVAGSDVLDNNNSDQGPSIALNSLGIPYVLYLSASRTYTSGAYYGATLVRYRSSSGWVDASPPVDALSHTPQIYMQGDDVYSFLGHNTAIHFAYLYRLIGQPWTAVTTLDSMSTTDGSASIRWDPVRENNSSVIDASYYDEDINDNKTYLPFVYYMAVLPRGQQPGQTPDTTAPAVSVTSPSANATVGGNVTVSATASDDRGVSGVQFQLDGSPLGGVSTSPPYSTSWNASGATGSHTLAAVAWDAAGNRTTSVPVQVTVDNSAGPAPPAFVRDLGTSTIANSGSSIALVVPSAGVSAGDSVVVWAIMSGGGGVTVSTVTDSRGNAFTVDSSLSNSGVNAFVASARAMSPLQPGDKITVTFSGTYYSLRAIAAAEFSGVSAVTDVKAGATGSNAAPTSGAITPGFAPDLLVAGVGTTSAAALAPRPGFTLLPPVSVTASGTTRTIQRMYQVAAAKGTFTGGGTLGAATAWTAGLVAYH